MTARDLLNEITRYDARLVRTDAGLKVQAPAPLPADLMTRLRQHKAELLRMVDAEAEKAGRVLHTNHGRGYQHPDGLVETGTPEPMPPPAADWPADLDAMLRRVATRYEWSTADRRDFIAWARRSPDGLADARQFLQSECAKLAPPGLSDRRRVVLDMLAADPSIRYAWTCTDTGADPVTLTLAIRGAGTCELAIPRAKFSALELPMLIDRFTSNTAPADSGINGD